MGIPRTRGLRRYTSAATRLMSVRQLVELIEQIRPKNERLGLTGLLLYSGGNVIQTLEGMSYAVDAAFELLESFRLSTA